MRRHCGRPGCNAVATATFSFDATRCVVWLNPIEAGMPRAGDLCTRHADGMAPPKGWERIDRRNEPVAAPAGAATVAVDAAGPATTPAVPLTDDLLPSREPVKRKRKPAVKKRWEEVPSLFEPAATPDPTPAPVVGAPVVPVAPVATAPVVAATVADPVAAPTPAPVVEPAVEPPVVTTPVVEAPAAEEPVAAAPVVDEPEVDANRWMPRFVTDDDLGGVLDATTPLLSRAFNNARPSDDTDDPKPTDAHD